jgi:hypothetical protein
MRLAALALLLTAAPALAHKLNVDVTPRTDPRRLAVRAYYDGDDPSDGATAVVRDAAGAEVGRATLDANGEGSLPWPAGEWAVTVDDGAGHRTTVRFDRRGTGESPARWFAVLAGLLLIGGWAGWRRMRSAG